METFRISTAALSDRYILSLTGEVDLAAQPQLTTSGEAALADPDRLTLVIDLAQVTFIDSTGLGTLIHLRNLAHASGKDLVLAATPPPVQRILQLTALDDIFTHAGG
jgi:anti-sigma B factor antagonist